MQDWDLTDFGSEIDPQDAERRVTLWQNLEQDGVTPDRSLMALLSGLMDDDLLRMRTLWPGLGTAVRRELTEILLEISAADFVMDFSAIFRIALLDPDADVRTSALQGLAEVEDVRLVPEYVRILHSDPSPEARRAAAEGLGRFVLLGELQKIRPAPFHKAVQALQASYTRPGEALAVRQCAVEAMAFTGEYGVPAMIKRAYTDGDSNMRRSAIVAMGHSADDTWAQFVQRRLVSSDPRMRLAAVRACGELQIEAAVEDIISLTDDVDVDVQAMALWALGQIGGTLARKTLRRFTKSDDEARASAAGEALQELEFYHGDASSFFGAPEAFSGASDGAWHFPGLGDLPESDEEYDVDSVEDEEGESEEDDEADYLVGYLGLDDDDEEDDEDDDAGDFDWEDDAESPKESSLGVSSLEDVHLDNNDDEVWH